MPTYRSISVELHSQFDVETIPEYFPLPQTYYEARGMEGKAPPLVDDKISTCSVYVPVLPASQFWISYSISPTMPVDQQFFFKLFINAAHIVSWSCGKADGWKGKTMFGLFEKEDGEDGKRRIEKRALCFTPPDREDGRWKDVTDAFDKGAHMEIRVYRACGRTRVAREMEDFAKTPHGMTRRGIDLVNAGRASGEHPKRFYKFALIDPLDKPFATFRYMYRSWDQLYELGLLDEITSSELSPKGRYSSATGIPDPQKMLNENGEAVGDYNAGSSASEGATTGPARAYVPTGAPVADEACSSDCSDETMERHSGVGTPLRFYRLSVPPSLKLDPPTSPAKKRPMIPQKSDSTSSTSYKPHPAYPMEEWVVRTPSPVKSTRDGISTPPPGARRGFSATGFMSAVANVWKRRGTPSSEFSSDGGSRTAYRQRT